MRPETIQDQLFRVFKSITDGIIIIDIEGTVVFSNSASETMLGFSPGRFAGKTFDSIAVKITNSNTGRVQSIDNPFSETIRTQKGLRNLVYRYKHPDNTVVFLQIETAPLFDKNDNIQHVVLLLKDITKTINDEVELEKLSLAVKYSPNPVIITDADAVIEYVNPKFTELTGYTFQESVGQNPRILKSNLTPQSTYDKLWNVLPEGEVWRGEFINKMKNGKTYNQKSAIAPVKDPDGMITHYVAVIEDVTKQREAEAALVESERRLKEIIEHGGLIVAVIDIDGRLIDVNDFFVELIDLPKKTLIGKSLYEFVVPEQSEGLQLTIAETVTRDEVQSDFDAEVLDGYDDIRTISFSAVPLHDTLQEVTGVACIGRDITERKRAAQEVLESRKQVLDILESISDAFFALDNLWRFTYVNRNAEKLLGKTRVELLFKDFHQALPDFAAYKLYKLTIEAKEKMKPLSFEEYYPFIDSWYEGQVFPYENGVSVYLLNTTKRKLAEKERNLYMNKLALIIDSTYEGIYGLDNEGRCTLFNASASKMTGYTSEEVLGKDMHQLIHHSYRDGSPYSAENCPIINATKKGQVVRVDSDVFWRKDGTYFTVMYASYPIYNENLLQGSVVTFSSIDYANMIKTRLS